MPQEGGWLTYKRFAKDLGKEYVEISSPNALIDLEDLKVKLQDCPQGSMFIYHSLGAYCAPQDVKQIYEICHRNNVAVMMDVSGSFGTLLANGKFADVCFASFGKWKIVDYGTGGFISCKTKEMFDFFKPLFSAVTFPQRASDEDYSNLLHKIDSSKERIEFLQQKGTQVIEDMKQDGFSPLHSNTTFPFVVIVPFANDLDRLKIIGYCTKTGLEYTQCPREIRVMQKAISIEIKRL